MDDKYDLKACENFRYTEDGASYDYAKTPLTHDDLKIDINRLDVTNCCLPRTSLVNSSFLMDWSDVY